jgi:hypothetical protein
MLNTPPSMFQQYNQNKDNVVNFVPLAQKKEHAREVVRNIAQTIFKRFGCGSVFNDDCIKNFGEMYDPDLFKIGLLNFQPNKSIFSFMSSIHAGDFLKISNDCHFFTNEEALLSGFKVSYSFVSRRNSEFIGSYLHFFFDCNLNIDKISYNRVNEKKESLVNVEKTKDMLCSIDEETMFIELFLNAHNCDVRDLFPAFYQEGAYTFDMNEIKSNIAVARMLII